MYLKNHHRASSQIFQAKRIRVFENGRIVNGRIVCINPRKIRTWNSCLKDITHTLKPTFGAVRHLRTRDGLRSIHCLDDLESNGLYVALGIRKSFKHLQYGTLPENRIRKKGLKHYLSVAPDSFTEHWTLAEAYKKRRTIVYIFANGLAEQEPAKIVFIDRDFYNWKTTLRYISSLLDMPDGISKLYTLQGDEVIGPCELQHGACYVAASFGQKFVPLSYMAIYDHYLYLRNQHNNEYTKQKFDLTVMGSPVETYTHIICNEKGKSHEPYIMENTETPTTNDSESTKENMEAQNKDDIPIESTTPNTETTEEIPTEYIKEKKSKKKRKKPTPVLVQNWTYEDKSESPDKTLTEQTQENDETIKNPEEQVQNTNNNSVNVIENETEKGTEDKKDKPVVAKPNKKSKCWGCRKKHKEPAKFDVSVEVKEADLDK